eukprot:jgi/Tetstr1/458759/TSEL_045144.t1
MSDGGRQPGPELAERPELNWSGVLRHVCTAAREGVGGAAGTCRMDPRNFAARWELLAWAAAQTCPLVDGRACASGGGERRAGGDPVGDVESRRWTLSSKICEWAANCGAAAAQEGHLDVLQWAREQGCPWDEVTCAEAAGEGNLEVLQWARAQGCPWDDRTCFWAAKGGHLAALQWARAQGCPWERIDHLRRS